MKQTLSATILALGATLTGAAAAHAQAPVCAPASSLAPPLASFDPGARLYSRVPAPWLSASPAPACDVAALGQIPPHADQAAPILTPERARAALARARVLGASGRVTEAELALDLVEAVLPRLADRVALERGRLELAEDPARAQASFQRATDSVDGTVRVRAKVGVVRAAIAADARDAEHRLNMLMRRYPELSEEGSLRLALGESQERQGNPRTAARIYQALDLLNPGKPEAARARAAMTRLREAGVWMRALNAEERVARLERLLRSGPFPLARTELATLRANHGLPVELKTRVTRAAARLASIEGRFGDEAELLRHGRAAAVPDDDPTDVETLAAAHAAAARVVEEAAAREDIASLRGRRAYRLVPTTRLFRILDVGARAGLADVVDATLEALARRNLPPRLRFSAAITATGVGQESQLQALLGGLGNHPSLGLASRYHLARSLERSGDLESAERAYLEVAQLDQSGRRYYGMWAELRLQDTRAQLLLHPTGTRFCGPDEALAEADASRPRIASRGLVDTRLRTPRPAEGSAAVAPVHEPTAAPTPDFEALALALAPVAEAHGEAFPWFGRTVDLLALHEADAAGDELYEAYLAYRRAMGRPVARAGVASVSRGADRRRTFVPFPVKRARRALTASARQIVADVAAALGETGTEVGFGGRDRLRRLPRAYATQVERAAANHGLDPNLLFAVMRVESIYQARIVSYAGAVGLMQIMPRTGRHIADAMGKTDFETADLLDPETNLDFAAWYLASLIERFDGHLPLAIASYNGGPHNVRRWIHEHAMNMPLDTFLEEIPFTQTHRYVRRVLTYYSDYRAQQNLPMAALSVQLPQPGADRVGF